MRLASLALALIALTACAPPAHMQHVGHKRGGRTLPDLIMGGWDGRNLRLFNDTQLRLQSASVSELVEALKLLSNTEYGTVFLESSKLDHDEAEARGFFCEAPWCVVVFERGKGRVLKEWGQPVAIFELSGVGEHGVLGNVWLTEGAIRAPGPTRWELMCRDDDDTPRYIHPDGNAYFPARPAFGEETWARFGESELADAYRAGTRAPNERTCDYQEARRESQSEQE